MKIACIKEIYKKTGSVAKLKLYAHLYKTIKANIVLTVKSFISINYFFVFQYKYYMIFNFATEPYLLLRKKYLRQQMMSQVLNLSLKLFFNWE